MGRSKKRHKKGWYTPISRHQRRGSQLVSSMGTMNMEALEWERDLLPEYLWIASLEAHLPANLWPTVYNRFMDAIDTVMPKDGVALGFITDFGMVPADARAQFKEANREVILKAFHKPFGRIVAFYPESPAYWLVLQDEIEREGSLDPQVELRRLHEILVKLFGAKDLIAGHIRAVPLNRIFAHKKIFLPTDMPSIDLLPKYPDGCTEDEKYQVQQLARIIVNMQYQHFGHYKSKEWPRYFWRHNDDLVPCQPRHIAITGDGSVGPEEARPLYTLLEANSKRAIEYVRSLATRVRCDLYDPTRDEILLGLLARLTRLYVVMSLDPALWARDTGGIILRCLTDTAISFSYLAKKGSPEEFSSFRKYGEGKEKLLMLHLQDTHAGETSLEGRTSEEIAQELGGGFNPELIDVELDNWTKKSVRDLAMETEMGRFYRLVYDPSSSDLHGTWVSLKHSNLRHCGQALHRFHRLPTYVEPPVYVQTMVLAHQIYLHCLNVGTEVLNYPPITNPLMEPQLEPGTAPEPTRKEAGKGQS